MSDEREQQAVEGAPESNGDAGEIARSFLEEVLRAMGMEADVSCAPLEEGTYRLDMAGPEMGTVIGRQGSTLGALQYLVSLVVQRRAGRHVRLILDAEGYRSRREEALRDNARQLAEEVKQSGQECVLDPMSAFDRRIVHTALADDPDVYTYSEGEDPERCVVISPRSSQPPPEES